MAWDVVPDAAPQVSEMQKTPIAQRIRENFRVGILYHDLMRPVFPEDQYPKAMRPSSNGGPPGCAMAFGKALRRCGLTRDHKTGLIYRTRECKF